MLGKNNRNYFLRDDDDDDDNDNGDEECEYPLLSISAG